MKFRLNGNQRLGILGGGQLGKMLLQSASIWDIDTWVLDQPGSPGSHLCKHFVPGDFRDYQTVLDFGRQVDLLTIEIEHVNIEALHQLESEGKTIHPRPGALAIIKDKGLQKQFYEQHGLPTAPYQLHASKEALLTLLTHGQLEYPFVQKSRTDGYDGKGVAVIQSEQDHHLLLDGPCMTEKMVPIAQEIAVQVVRNATGTCSVFPPVEMVFNPVANLLDLLLCPARITVAMAQKAQELAIQTINAFDLCGLLSVEFFVSTTGELLVNEVAPRPHNSGHHTIEACFTSQYEQHLRGIFNWPLGSTQLKMPAAMVNLLGAPGHSGPACYEGMEACLEVPGAYFHLYGKTETRPYRKMGHATVIHPELAEARRQAEWISRNLIIRTGF